MVSSTAISIFLHSVLMHLDSEIPERCIFKKKKKDEKESCSYYSLGTGSVSGKLMFRVDGTQLCFLGVYGNLLIAVSPE